MDVSGLRQMAVKLADDADEEGLSELIDELHRLTNDAEGRRRAVLAAQTADAVPPLTTYDGKERLRKAVLMDEPPWSAIDVPELGVPGMITQEEAQYYLYLARFFSGEGHAVELGPWLGRSTSYLVNGFSQNPKFAGEKLVVFDDFIWRSSWMDRYVESIPDLPHRVKDRESFRSLFDHYAKPIASWVEPRECYIEPSDDNRHLAPLSWDGGPIEVCIVDCGRTISVNEAWYSTFSPHFIPGKTLVVMQDWRLHREVPVKYWNQTKLFTDSKPKLELVHELSRGDIATFLYH